MLFSPSSLFVSFCITFPSNFAFWLNFPGCTLHSYFVVLIYILFFNSIFNRFAPLFDFLRIAAMSDQSFEVDKYGYYTSRGNRSRSPSNYSDGSDQPYRSHSRSRSHTYKHHHRSDSRSRSRSYSRPRSSQRDWIVPTNPLLRGDDSDHHHHRHHHHHHRHRSHSPKRLTVADKKERWGHELYIENVRAIIV